MPVRLRMQRYGAKKRPYYRMVATDKRNPRDGRFIEMLGTYDPLQEPAAVRLNSERVEYWLSVGAQPTDTVLSLVRRMRRGDVVDLSQEGADEEARKALAEQKRQEQEELRAKITEDAKAAKADAEAKKADEAAGDGGEGEESSEEAAGDEGEESPEEAAGDEGEEESSDDADESEQVEDASDEEE